MFKTIKTDIEVNKYNTKGLVIILMFRLANYFATKSIALKILGFPIRVIYKLFIEWGLGIELPDSTRIGKGIRIFHGQGLVVNPATIISEYVTLRQNTTIGNKDENGKSPYIGSNVNIGANSVIIGEIIIGNNCIIGAGSVVTKDVIPNSIVVGNPARVIQKNDK